MQMEEFLEQLQGICFQESEKQNQLYSQQQNFKKSSKSTKGAIPFSQSIQFKKSKKKITFKLPESSSIVQNQLQKINVKQSEEIQVCGGKKEEIIVQNKGYEQKKEVTLSQKQGRGWFFSSTFQDKMKILRKIR